jgi:hypothetical protein
VVDRLQDSVDRQQIRLVGMAAAWRVTYELTHPTEDETYA